MIGSTIKMVKKGIRLLVQPCKMGDNGVVRLLVQPHGKQWYHIIALTIYKLVNNGVRLLV